MSFQSAFQDELQSSPVPMLLADSGLTPLCWNEAAGQLLPTLAADLSLPEQFPSMLWLTVPSALRLMRPASITLKSGAEKLSLTMFPLFEQGSFSAVSCVIAPASGTAPDPSYAMALHDLSTPIASISSCTDLLINHVPEQQQPYLQIIRRSTLHIQRILTGMATSMDAAMSITGSNTDLSEMARTLVDQVRPILVQHSTLNLTLITEGHPIVRCNSAQIERVLLNLLSNAIKFAEETISVSVGQEGETALICVENDGRGIPPRDLPHIFTPWFSQGANGAAGGSGLGLSVVDQMTRINGGRVDVESRPGRTRFVVSLPVSWETGLSAGGKPYLLTQSRYATLYELELALNGRTGPQKGPELRLL